MKKFALITGSTKGIGKQIGLDLLDKEYFVYFNGRDVHSFPEYPSSGLIVADLSDINQIYTIELNIKTLDVLILNVGMTDRTPFKETSLFNWKKVIDTNLTVPFFLIQSLQNRIKENGRIIFITSIAGCTTDSTSIAYGVSKGAIHVLVPYLAKEFADRKITVNAIAPGYIDTDWHKDKSRAQIKRIEQKCLAKRLGTTKEISKTVMSIIDNDFINGQVIRVDGGFNGRI